MCLYSTDDEGIAESGMWGPKDDITEGGHVENEATSELWLSKEEGQ